jgi:hypothetical protein
LDDLRWWNEILPYYNGVRFFNDSSRPIVHLYTDASKEGFGGFFIAHHSASCDWRQHVHKIPKSQSFSLPAIQQDGTCEFDINIGEIQAVLEAFRIWGWLWASSRCKVIIHSDNTTTAIGLVKQTLSRRQNRTSLNAISCYSQLNTIFFLTLFTSLARRIR